MAKVADIRLEIRSALDKAGIELAKMELEALKTKATEANVKIERSFRGPEEALERVRARTEKAGTVVEEVYVPAAVAAERRAMEMRRRLEAVTRTITGLTWKLGILGWVSGLISRQIVQMAKQVWGGIFKVAEIFFKWTDLVKRAAFAMGLLAIRGFLVTETQKALTKAIQTFMALGPDWMALWGTLEGALMLFHAALMEALLPAIREFADQLMQLAMDPAFIASLQEAARVFVESLVPAIIDFIRVLPELIASFANWAPLIMQVLQAAMPLVPVLMLLSTVLGVLQPLLLLVGVAFTAIIAAATPLFAKAMLIAIAIAACVAAFYLAMVAGQALAGFITGTLIPGLAWLGEQIWGLFGALAEAIGGFIQGFIAGLQDAWNRLVSGATWMWEQIYGGITWLVESILASFQWLADALLGVGAAIWDALTAGFGALWQTIMSGVEWLAEALPAAWEAISTALISVSEHLVEAIPALWDTLTRQVGGAVDSLSKAAVTAFQTLYRTLDSLAKQIADAILAGFNWLVEEVPKAIGRLWEFLENTFSELRDLMFRWAQDAVRAFIDGLLSLIDQVKSAAESIASAIGKFLGIASRAEWGPLRELELWPREFIETYASGLLAGRNILEAVASRLAEATQLRQPVQREVIEREQIIERASPTTKNIYITIDIGTVASEVDVDELVEKVRRAVAEEEALRR